MIPANAEAEESLIGAMLLSPEARSVGLANVEAADFHSPELGRMFAAIRVLHSGGKAVDPVTVSAAIGGESSSGRLIELLANVPSTRSAMDYARVVTQHAAGRRLLGMCSETAKAIQDMADPYECVEHLRTDLARIETPVDRSRQEAQTIDEVVATAEVASPWAIDGLMRVDWRVLLVAGEGAGKSTILRQLAMLAAQGVHPLKFTPVVPIRSLIVDLENPVAAIAETGGRMAQRLATIMGPAYDPTRCRIFRRPGGIDLRSRHDRGELEREIVMQSPDLICIGPAYKLIHRRAQRAGNESHEEATDPVLEILDDLRTRHTCALVIEHHAPQGHGGGRDLRPYGSQRWLAWPEIGLSLRRDRETPNRWNLERHRGDRLASNWPEGLSHGSEWPWVGQWRDRQEDMF